MADMVADMVHSAPCAQVMHIAATKISVERSAQGRRSRVHLDALLIFFQISGVEPD